MSFAQQLRGRFLTALSSSLLLGGFIPLACGGAMESPSKDPIEPMDPAAPVEPVEPPSKESLLPSCEMGGRGEVRCFAPGSVQGSPSLVDANNCQIQVQDSCCNAAQTGPALIEGQCCYGFCAGSCCGRPLLVGGEARIAPAVERADWAATYDPQLAGLSTAERSALADKWLNDARFEHASIASFARFCLDLLAFGAPPELVERAQRAMGDEIAHARACFALASAYAGRALGPGRLELRGVEPSCSLAEAAAAAVREGCVNETVAALTAQRQAERTADPVVRAVLERIASDEAGHAELAFRFVAWALQTGDAAVHYAVRSAFRTPPRDQLEGVAEQAWREVIAPVAAQLS
jgi:hypothetical protein